MDCADHDSGALSAAATSDVVEPSTDAEAAISCSCGNDNRDLFEVVKNDSGSVVYVRCWNCNGEFRATPRVCGCSDELGGNSHDVVFDEFGYVSKVICHRCKAEVDCGAKNSVPSTVNGETSLGRTRVEALTMLGRGDHIAWHQPLSYWHHAIVSGVDSRNNEITVINYNGPNTHKGEVLFASVVWNFVVKYLFGPIDVRLSLTFPRLAVSFHHAPPPPIDKTHRRFSRRLWPM
jgi:hypothetical protein